MSAILKMLVGKAQTDAKKIAYKYIKKQEKNNENI